MSGHGELSSLLQEHREKTEVLRHDVDRRKKELGAHSQHLVNDLVDSVNTGVGEAFRKQRTVEGEIKRLQAETDRYAKQTAQWVKAVDDLNNALKELGDVENWGHAIEKDLKSVAESLERL